MIRLHKNSEVEPHIMLSLKPVHRARKTLAGQEYRSSDSVHGVAHSEPVFAWCKLSTWKCTKGAETSQSEYHAQLGAPIPCGALKK
jgi:hypothetical protein